MTLIPVLVRGVPAWVSTSASFGGGQAAPAGRVLDPHRGTRDFRASVKALGRRLLSTCTGGLEDHLTFPREHRNEGADSQQGTLPTQLGSHRRHRDETVLAESVSK